MKYNIALVDDHRLFREGLKSLLLALESVSTVFETDYADEFIKYCEKTIPDIVFMDIEMPGKNGIELTKEAVTQFPDIKIIGLSMYGDENYYTKMIDAGAKGFLLKNSGIDDIENAIKEISAGNNYFSPEILNRLIKSFGNKKNTSSTETLTKRELEVLYHICKGLSNQEIADNLYLSKRTIDKHRENLLSKTQSKNTAGLVMYAVKNKLIEY